MKRFLIALAVLALATLLVLAGYMVGVFGTAPAPNRDQAIDVGLEGDDDHSRLRITLKPEAQRRSWQAETSAYWVRVARTGGDEYHFQVARRLSDRTLSADTRVRLQPGETLQLAEFRSGAAVASERNPSDHHEVHVQLLNR